MGSRFAHHVLCRIVVDICTGLKMARRLLRWWIVVSIFGSSTFVLGCTREVEVTREIDREVTREVIVEVTREVACAR